MKYVIYEMVQPSHLREIKPDGYYQKTICRDVLQILDVNGVKTEHETFEMAISEIVSKKDKLKQMQLTIIPVISISWDGELS